MSPLMIACTAAMVLAGIQYVYANQKRAANEQPPIEATMYTFVCAFGLVYMITYSLVDDKAAAMQEMELGEPDF